MSGFRHQSRWIAIGAIPIAAVALWLASGREVLTKPIKHVDMAVRDNLFGGTNLETQDVRGPIWGYFIGLDLVIVACGFSGFGILLMWAIHRRRRRRSASVREGVA